MRKAAIAALAAWCGLSFVVVCLAACLGASDAKHACCEPKEGVRLTTAARDCCDVMPAQMQASLDGPAVTEAPAAILSSAVKQLAPALEHTTSPLAAASPPLVLRV